MMFSAPVLFESLILIIAVCVDSFVASFAYGTNKVKIPFWSMVIINCLCSGILVLFLYLGTLITPLLPAAFVQFIGFFILFMLGVVKLFDSSIKILIQKTKVNAKELAFSFHNVKFILTVYANPNMANADQSNTLSPSEAISLGIALSLDSAVVGLGAGDTNSHLVLLLLLSLIIGAISILLGSVIGQKIAEKTNLNLSWISGVLLMILAVLKFF